MWQHLCLSGQGQARVHFRQNRHVVAFESYLDRDHQVWYVALEIPGRGQELIQMNYAAQEVQVSGRFYQRLQHYASQEHDMVRVWLDDFVDFLAQVPRWRDHPPKGSHYYRHRSGHVVFEQPIASQERAVELLVGQLHDEKQYYQRVHFRLTLGNQVGPEAHPAQLYLFFSECREL